MADIRIDAWGEKGDGPRKYYAPDCLFPQTSDGVTDEFRQGINNGWSDVYDWYIPDQYIEVTGVPNGYYRLEFCADPFNEIEEENEDNNCVVNHIRLSGMEGPEQESRGAAHHRTGPARRRCAKPLRISEAEWCGSGPGRRPRPRSRPRPVPLWSPPAPGRSQAPPNRA